MSDKRQIELWMEGYAVTGNSGTARKVDTVYASTSEEALEMYANKNKGKVDVHTDEDGKKWYSDWGCKIYDNEVDARKSFG
jgi:hypothetical protein